MPINPNEITWDTPTKDEVIWDSPKKEDITWDTPKKAKSPDSLLPSPSISADKPKETPPVMEQLKVYGLLEGMPPEFAAELKKSALEYGRRGGYLDPPLKEPDITVTGFLGEAYKNIEPNVADIVRDTSSMLMFLGREAVKFGVNTASDLNKLHKGEMPEKLASIEQLKGLKQVPGVFWDQIKNEYGEMEDQGTKRYLINFAKDKPVDAALLLNAARAASGTATKLGLKGIKKVAKNGSQIGATLDKILSTDRTPLAYKLNYTAFEGGPEASAIKETAKTINKIKFERQYSQDPITKYIFQKSFDKIIDKYPRLKTALTEYKAGKFLTDLRKTYDRANVQQRIKLHKEIDEMLGTLTKEELQVMVPYLEGRAKLLGNASDEFDKFEGWYRKLMKKGEDDFAEMGVLSPERVDELIYDPIMKSTGKSLDEVKTEFGDFTPAYVHQAHTEYPKMLSVEFADTTGKRFKPGILKKRIKGEGYSEDLKDILPKWASDYIKFKNTEEFISDMTSNFGVPVNLKNIEQVHGGFKIPDGKGGSKVYKNYRIVAPDGFLRFFKTKIDFYQQISKKLNDMDLDEAIGTQIKESVEGFKETSRVISETGEQVSRQAKMIEDRVREALLSRGFAAGETNQMLERVKSMGIEGVKEIVTEKEYTKVKEIIKTVGLDPNKLKTAFAGTEQTLIGVTKNQRVYLVPEKIASRLENWAAPLVSPSFQNIVKIAYDKPINIWKDSVLAMTPRWIKNNVIGDILFNTMEGVGPASYARSFSAKYTKVIPDELLKASFAEVMKYNPQLGTAAKNAVGQAIKKIEDTKIVKNISKAKDFMYGINTAFEQPFVRALYIKNARDKAISLLKADKQPVNNASILYKMEEIKNSPSLREPIIKKVKDTLPVFDLTGNAERKVLKRLMPFYNWYKFMGLYAAKLPKNHPFKTVGARGLGALSEIERESAFSQMFPFMQSYISENGVPDRYNNLWPVKYDDKTGEAIFFNTRGSNPFTTLEDFAEGNIVNMLSPIIKLTVERGTGVEGYTRRKFKTAEKGKAKVFREYEKELPPLGEHILKQFPQYQLLKQILVPAKQWDDATLFNPKPIVDKITGEYKYPIKNIDKILNYMGVDRRTINIEDTWLYFNKMRQRAIGETFKKEQSQDDKYLTAKEIKELFNYIRADPEKWDNIKQHFKDLKTLQQKVDIREKKKLIGIKK